MDQYGLTKDDKLFGMLCHLSSFSTILIPMGFILGPLIIWLIKKDSSAFVNDQGKEALNFQISMIVYGIAGSIICAILMLVVIGFILLILLWIGIGLLWLIMTIIASVRAYEGQTFRYPITIRFIS